MPEADILPEIRDVLALDKTIHEPARLAILALLLSVDSADFTWLMRQTGLTQGNLSAHLGKLDAAGLVSVEKGFEGKRPKTTLRITQDGAARLNAQGKALIRFLGLIDIRPSRGTKTRRETSS
ncbi:transcriptional regulator [Maricaulis sp.]|uniref:transcriptional regulator n=1 Tax=Maricaulis sp. TaxID=1486257 RepID=UPI001B282B92|nr:transcriptional regulator [Maricaulis sp.]MBO6763398.1 transcriptional regulator [Maricaulis sp.]